MWPIFRVLYFRENSNMYGANVHVWMKHVFQIKTWNNFLLLGMKNSLSYILPISKTTIE